MNCVLVTCEECGIEITDDDLENAKIKYLGCTKEPTYWSEYYKCPECGHTIEYDIK